MPLQYDTTHRIAIKLAIEEVLGREAWYELKETTSVTPWRKNLLKVLKAIRLSIDATVEIKDKPWSDAVEANLKEGEQDLKSSKDIDELLSSFEATLLKQVFLQLGMLPKRAGRPGVALRKENWRLNGHRSVQYVQSQAQLEAIFWGEQQRLIGVEKQMELHNEHRWSKSPLSYSAWCRERESCSA